MSKCIVSNVTMWTHRIGFVVFILGGLIGCEKNPNPTHHEEKNEPKESANVEPHHDEPEHEELPKRVRLTSEVISSAKIKTTPVVREKLATVLDLPGELAANPDRMAHLTVPLAGSLEHVGFREGNVVKKGDVLATIRVTDLAARHGALASLTAKSSAARANADRLTALGQNGLASAQEISIAQAEANSLDAESKAASENMKALGLSPSPQKANSVLQLRAPISGTVIERNAIVGQLANPEHSLATIADISEIWFLGRVFERDLARIQIGHLAEVELNAYPNERFEGIIEYISKQVDPAARTVVARVKLQGGKNAFRIGLFGTARIATAEPSQTEEKIVVPRTAVTNIGGKEIVFVAHPDNDFEVHEVVLGQSALGKTEILSGLREGEIVVTEGVFTIKSIILKNTFGEEE